MPKGRDAVLSACILGPLGARDNDIVYAHARSVRCAGRSRLAIMIQITAYESSNGPGTKVLGAASSNVRKMYNIRSARGGSRRNCPPCSNCRTFGFYRRVLLLSSGSALSVQSQNGLPPHRGPRTISEYNLDAHILLVTGTDYCMDYGILECIHHTYY